MEKTPNIFDYATSELSQDAMFAWLINWSNPVYAEYNPTLNQIGNRFVRLLLNKRENFRIDSIRVSKQWKNIDLWAKVNDDIVLVIEDKVETKEHSNQLERYRDIALQRYKDTDIEIYCVYIKTGNEPNARLERIRKKGYTTIERTAILSCIGNDYACHPLLNDYYNHLRKIEDATMSFKVLPVAQWGWYAWQGFYKEIEKHITNAEWDYTSNPNGGFLVLWWNDLPIEDVSINLQFEQDKLCFKIDAQEHKNRSEIRWKYHQLLMENIGEHIEIKRPNRFGAGRHMTIGYVDTVNLFGDGIVNIEEIILKVRQYEAIVTKCVEIVSSSN